MCGGLGEFTSTVTLGVVRDWDSCLSGSLSPNPFYTCCDSRVGIKKSSRSRKTELELKWRDLKCHILLNLLKF